MNNLHWQQLLEFSLQLLRATVASIPITKKRVPSTPMDGKDERPRSNGDLRNVVTFLLSIKMAFFLLPSRRYTVRFICNS